MRRGPPEADALKWISFVLFLAAVYNGVWGALAVAAPREMLAWVGVAPQQRVELWQCIGMLVGLYGAAYWIASTHPLRYWPFVLIGLAGKLLGPLGAVLAIASGDLPASFLWVNVTNDLVWWGPFAWILWTLRRVREEPGEPGRALPLYRCVLGRRFDELSPRIRRFHDATRPIEVRGVFRATRGSSRVGNWLTDRAGFPRSGEPLEVSLRVEPTPRGERWRRRFGDSVVESWQCRSRGHLAERFGRLVMYLEADVVDGALVVRDLRSTFLGIPLPPFLTPRVHARGIDADRAIEVAVRISCSPLGLLVEYGGRVELAPTPDGKGRSAPGPHGAV